MPAVTRWAVRTALVYLVAALGLGVVAAAAPASGLGPTTVHLLVVGWLTQLIFGVAFWMFPKREPSNARLRERLAWAAYGLLNAGLVLRAAVEPLVARGYEPLGPLLVASALCQWLAAVAFVADTWPRVRGRG